MGDVVNKKLGNFKPVLTLKQMRTLEHLEPFYDDGRSAVLASMTRSSAQLQAILRNRSGEPPGVHRSDSGVQAAP